MLALHRGTAGYKTPPYGSPIGLLFTVNGSRMDSPFPVYYLLLPDSGFRCPVSGFRSPIPYLLSPISFANVLHPLPGLHLLPLLEGLLYGATHEERLLRQLIAFPIEKHLETFDGVLDFDVSPFGSGEGLGDEEGL